MDSLLFVPNFTDLVDTIYPQIKQYSTIYKFSIGLYANFGKYKKEDAVWLPMRQLSTKDQKDTDSNNYRSPYTNKSNFYENARYPHSTKINDPQYGVIPILMDF